MALREIDRRLLRLPGSRRKKIVRSRVRALVRDLISATSGKNEFLKGGRSDRDEIVRELTSEILAEMKSERFLERIRNGSNSKEDTATLIDKAIQETEQSRERFK